MNAQEQRTSVDVRLDTAQPVSWPGNESVPADDFTLDEILRTLSPEEWFPTASIDIPLWCA